MAFHRPTRRWLAELLEIEGPASVGRLAARTGLAVGSVSHPGRVSSVTSLGDMVLVPLSVPALGALVHATSVLVATLVFGPGDVGAMPVVRHPPSHSGPGRLT